MRSYCLAIVGLLAGAVGASAEPELLAALANRPDITPENLPRFFADFSFELNSRPQDPETFLRRKRGDCDDFASLANRLLIQRGYQTKLVAVMMARQTHVVCYVPKAHGFLDYNHRADVSPVIPCGEALEEIAQKVAEDFRSPWRTVSEFRYRNNVPVYLTNVFAGPISHKAVSSASSAVPSELVSLRHRTQS